MQSKATFPSHLPTGPEDAVITSPWPSQSSKERGHQWHQHCYTSRQECNVLPCLFSVDNTTLWNQTTDGFKPWISFILILCGFAQCVSSYIKDLFFHRLLQPLAIIQGGRIPFQSRILFAGQSWSNSPFYQYIIHDNELCQISWDEYARSSFCMVNKMEPTLIEVVINCLLELIWLGPRQACRAYIISIIFKMCFTKGRVTDHRWQRNQSERISELPTGTPVYPILHTVKLNIALIWNELTLNLT